MPSTGILDRKMTILSYARANIFPVLRLAKPQRKLAAALIFLGIFNDLTGSFSVLLLLPILDASSSSSTFNAIPIVGSLIHGLDAYPLPMRIRILAIIILVSLLLKAILQFLTDFGLYELPRVTERSLKMRVLANLLASSPQKFADYSAGAISSNLTELPVRAGLALRFLVQSIMAIASIILTSIFVFLVNPIMFVLVIVSGAAGLLVFRSLTNPRTKAIAANLVTAQTRLSQILHETIQNRNLIYLYNASDYVTRYFFSELRRLRAAQMQTTALENLSYPFMQGGLAVIVSILIFLISFLSDNALRFTLPSVAIFLVLFTRIISPLTTLNICRLQYSVNKYAAADLEAFLDFGAASQRQSSLLRLGDEPLARLSNIAGISLKEIGFQIGDAQILHNVSLSANPGEHLCIIGPNGCGKTTLINIIAMVLDATAGSLLINESAHDTFARDSFLSKIAYCTQNSLFMDASVYENLTLGLSSEVSENTIHNIFSEIKAEAILASLPNGIHSPMGMLGNTLSGGQKQTVSLVRAALRNPDVVLLDEATSQMDYMSQRNTLGFIRTCTSKGKIVISVTHSPTYAITADKIAVMKSDGTLEAIGSHSQLYNSNTFYTQFVKQIIERGELA